MSEINYTKELYKEFLNEAGFDELSKDYGLDDNQKISFINLFKVRN
jgi:hypothetical protein